MDVNTEEHGMEEDGYASKYELEKGEMIVPFDDQSLSSHLCRAE
jgi:hypothetical protein